MGVKQVAKRIRQSILQYSLEACKVHYQLLLLDQTVCYSADTCRHRKTHETVDDQKNFKYFTLAIQKIPG